MFVLLVTGHLYDEAEAMARRLEREDLIERASYEPLPSHHFALCPYCPGIQLDAMLSWNWGTGSAESCSTLECAHAALDEALDDGADPENIKLTHPIFTLPTALAA